MMSVWASVQLQEATNRDFRQNEHGNRAFRTVAAARVESAQSTRTVDCCGIRISVDRCAKVQPYRHRSIRSTLVLLLFIMAAVSKILRKRIARSTFLHHPSQEQASILSCCLQTSLIRHRQTVAGTSAAQSYFVSLEDGRKSESKVRCPGRSLPLSKY